MKFRLQLEIHEDAGKIIEKKIYSGSEDGIIKCLEMMQDYIDTLVKQYHELGETIFAQALKEFDVMIDDALNGKPLTEELKTILEYKDTEQIS